jgi:gas vesicle protein
MKALIAALIASVFLFTAPAFAKGPGGAGKGVQNRERVREHVKTRSRVMEGEAGDKAVKIRETEQKRLERVEEVQEEKQEKVKEKSQEVKEGLEKQREKKPEQVQKELGKGSEKGQEAREMRRKWWKFWGKGE